MEAAASLNVLCVTAGAEYAWPFVAELEELADQLDARYVEVDGRGAGAIEYVLEHALNLCDPDAYVLRIDDDERVSDRMREWLLEREYLAEDHWSFPRAHLWPTADQYVTTAPLWPDIQTRLSVRSKAGGRHRIHAGSPFGAGAIAPVVLEHHKFLVRSEVERRECVTRYEELQTGAGVGFAGYSLPELYELDSEPYSSSARLTVQQVLS